MKNKILFLIVVILLVILLSSCGNNYDCEKNYSVEVVYGTFNIKSYVAESYTVGGNYIEIFGYDATSTSFNKQGCENIVISIDEDDIFEIKELNK